MACKLDHQAEKHIAVASPFVLLQNQDVFFNPESGHTAGALRYRMKNPPCRLACRQEKQHLEQNIQHLLIHDSACELFRERAAVWLSAERQNHLQLVARPACWLQHVSARVMFAGSREW